MLAALHKFVSVGLVVCLGYRRPKVLCDILAYLRGATVPDPLEMLFFDKSMLRQLMTIDWQNQWTISASLFGIVWLKPLLVTAAAESETRCLINGLNERCHFRYHTSATWVSFTATSMLALELSYVVYL